MAFRVIAESTLERDRLVALLSLALLAALAWLYLWREAVMMGSSGSMSMPAAGQPGIWSGITFLLTFTMWAVMMVGMMLPSAAPAILLYGTMARKNAERGVLLAAVWIFTAGYLVAWIGFSFMASLLQLGLQELALLTPGMASANVWLSGTILAAAGIYQLLPAKQVCLEKCRNPIELFLTRWRAGGIGAFRMGLEHGLFCLGCCWALMLVLFVAGAMNLLWVALIAGFVFVEKLLPGGRITARIAGVGLIASGLSVALLA